MTYNYGHRSAPWDLATSILFELINNGPMTTPEVCQALEETYAEAAPCDTSTSARLRKLCCCGLIESRDIPGKRVGRVGPRVVYRLTDEGEQRALADLELAKKVVL